MGVICQKSTCNAMTAELGDTVEVRPDGWFLRVAGHRGNVRWLKLTYCVFCGTHLLEVVDAPVSRVQPKKPALTLVPPAPVRKLAAEGVMGPSVRLAPKLAKIPFVVPQHDLRGLEPTSKTGKVSFSHSPPPPPPPGLRPDMTRKKR